MPYKIIGIRFDSVEQGRCKPGGGFDPDGPEIFRHNGCIGTVILPDINKCRDGLWTERVVVNDNIILMLPVQRIVMRL